MNASISMVDGKPTLTVYYDPNAHDWDGAIAAGLVSYGLERGKVKVIAIPLPDSPKSIRNGLVRGAEHPFPVKPRRLGRRVLFDKKDIDNYVDTLPS